VAASAAADNQAASGMSLGHDPNIEIAKQFLQNQGQSAYQSVFRWGLLVAVGLFLFTSVFVIRRNSGQAHLADLVEVQLKLSDLDHSVELAEMWREEANHSHTFDALDRYNQAVQVIERNHQALMIEVHHANFEFQGPDLQQQLKHCFGLIKASNQCAWMATIAPLKSHLQNQIESLRHSLNTEWQVILALFGGGTLLCFLIGWTWSRALVSERGQARTLAKVLEQLHEDLRVQHQKTVTAEEAKTNFLNSMSHEIRTPLNGILGLTQLLVGSPLNSQQSQWLKGLQAAGLSLLQMVNEVLDYAKVIRQGVQLTPEKVTLQSWLQETAHILRGPADLKGLELRVVDPGNICVDVDPVRLRQVLLNLGSNAIKFTESGFVELGVQAVGLQTYKFWVRDSGCGLEKADQEQLFQDFFQVAGEHQRGQQGTGLGLSVCAKIVNAMHGQIEVVSEVGQGSEFHFTVDLKTHPASTIAGSAFQASQSQAQAALLIDDNPLNLTVLAGLLQRFGVSSVLCQSPEQALQLLAEQNFSLIFSDLQMPVWDGFALLARVKEKGLLRAHQAYIACSAHSSEDLRQRCLQSGFTGLLAKPLQIGQLEDLLRGHAHLVVTTEKKVPVAGGLRESWNAKDAEARIFLHEILQIFVETWQPKYTALQIAFQQQNLKAVGEIAHYLKGSCGDIGALPLAGLFNAVEDSVQQGVWPPNHLWAELEREGQAVLRDVLGEIKPALPPQRNQGVA